MVAGAQVERDEVLVVLFGAGRFARQDSLAVDGHRDGIAGTQQQQMAPAVLEMQDAGGIGADVEA